MLAIHDHVTRQMSDRLGTTSIGLGLVRLLQDAKRFDEAREVLYALENGFQSVAEESEPSLKLVQGVCGPASLSSASPTTTDVAEFATQPLSIA